MNGNGARFALYGDAFARQFVQTLSVVLDRGVHGRQLLDLPAETGQNLLYVFTPDVPRRRGFNHLAFGIRGFRGLAKTHPHHIGFIGIEKIGRDARGLAKTQRQHARSQRIQAARMAGFLRLEQMLDFLQSGVGGQTYWFVQQQDAGYLASAWPSAPTHLRDSWRLPKPPARSKPTSAVLPRWNGHTRIAVRARFVSSSPAPGACAEILPRF